MKTFKDGAGREWLVTINTGAAKRVRAMCDLNLLDVTQVGEISSRLCQDMVLLSDVVYAVVKPDADKQQITQEMFDAGIGGDALSQMRVAVLEELRDFFQKDRPEIAAMLMKQSTLISQAAPVLIKKIEELTLESVIAEATARLQPPSTNLPTAPTMDTATLAPKTLGASSMIAPAS